MRSCDHKVVIGTKKKTKTQCSQNEWRRGIRGIRPDPKSNLRRARPAPILVAELVVTGPVDAVMEFFTVGCEASASLNFQPTKIDQFSLNPFRDLSGLEPIGRHANPYIQWDVRGVEGHMQTLTDEKKRNDTFHALLSALGPSAGCAWCGAGGAAATGSTSPWTSFFCSYDHRQQVRIQRDCGSSFARRRERARSISLSMSFALSLPLVSFIEFCVCVRAAPSVTTQNNGTARRGHTNGFG
jgi:hypothetical protein